MATSELPIAKITNVQGYDFYFTDKRSVVTKSTIKQKRNYGTYIGGALGGVIGAAIASTLTTAYQNHTTDKIPLETFDPNTLVELLKNKGSFELLHSDVEWIALNKSFSGGQLGLKGKKVWKYFNLSKEQFSQLADILPTITSLADRTKIN
jgi:hypothetical protein